MKNLQKKFLEYLLKEILTVTDYHLNEVKKNKAFFAITNDHVDDREVKQRAIGIREDHKEFFASLAFIGKSGVFDFHPAFLQYFLWAFKIPAYKKSFLNGLQTYHIKQELEDFKKLIYKKFENDLKKDIRNDLINLLMAILKDKGNSKEDMQGVFKNALSHILNKEIHDNDLIQVKTKKSSTKKNREKSDGKLPLNAKNFVTTQFNNAKFKKIIDGCLDRLLFKSKDKEMQKMAQNYLDNSYEIFCRVLCEFLNQPIVSGLKGRGNYLSSNKSDALKNFYVQFKTELNRELQKLGIKEEKSTTEVNITSPIKSKNIDEKTPLMFKNKIEKSVVESLFASYAKGTKPEPGNIDSLKSYVIKRMGKEHFIDNSNKVDKKSKRKNCYSIVDYTCKDVVGRGIAIPFGIAKIISSAVFAYWGPSKMNLKDETLVKSFALACLVDNFVVCTFTRSEGILRNFNNLWNQFIKKIQKQSDCKKSSKSLSSNEPWYLDPVYLFSDILPRWTIFLASMGIGTVASCMSPFFSYKSLIESLDPSINVNLLEDISLSLAIPTIFGNAASYVFFQGEQMLPNVKVLWDSVKKSLSPNQQNYIIDLIRKMDFKTVGSLGAMSVVSVIVASYYYIQMYQGAYTICDFFYNNNQPVNTTLAITNSTNNGTTLYCEQLSSSISNYVFGGLLLQLLVTQSRKIYDLLLGNSANPISEIYRASGNSKVITAISIAANMLFFMPLDVGWYSLTGYLGTQKFFNNEEITFGEDVSPIAVAMSLAIISFVFTHLGAFSKNIARLLRAISESSCMKKLTACSSCCNKSSFFTSDNYKKEDTLIMNDNDEDDKSLDEIVDESKQSDKDGEDTTNEIVVTMT